MGLDEHKLALVAGYVLTAGLFFGLGQYLHRPDPPEIKIEEPAIDLSKLNTTPNPAPAQQVAGETTDTAYDPNCEGKIKGNISAKSKIYHMPGGASYKQTIPEMCFDTESAAVAAGFRKSLR
ncbi:MAG: hypothetical protein Q8R08_01810 [bacterium]|nr:hypothetical protein [bacterium]